VPRSSKPSVLFPGALVSGAEAACVVRSSEEALSPFLDVRDGQTVLPLAASCGGVSLSSRVFLDHLCDRNTHCDPSVEQKAVLRRLEKYAVQGEEKEGVFRIVTALPPPGGTSRVLQIRRKGRLKYRGVSK
jgi:hypothetical protein